MKIKNIFIWTFALLKNHKWNRVPQQYLCDDVDFQYCYNASMFPDAYHIIIHIISLTSVFIRSTISKI